MKTTATPLSDGSSYVLNRSKLWISSAREASVFLVFANAAPNNRYRSITAFVVDANSPGLVVGKPEDTCQCFVVVVACTQGMQHQYALVATEIHAAEVMLYNAC